MQKETEKARGERKPETFDFLGFTFYCSKSRSGKFSVKLKTSKKKFRQKVKAMKVWLYQNRDIKVSELMEQIKIKLIGHYRYYGISHNGRMISCFRQRTIDFLYKILNRRSHKKSYTVEGFKEMLKVYKLEPIVKLV